MKKILQFSLFIICVWAFNTTHAQGLENVFTALKTGNATSIMQNAGANTLLTIEDKSGTYNKPQVQQLVKDFFSRVAVKGFELKHKGNSPIGRYAIGTLQTATGNYRVNIFMKKEDGAEVIKELRFQLIE